MAYNGPNFPQYDGYYEEYPADMANYAGFPEAPFGQQMSQPVVMIPAAGQTNWYTSQMQQYGPSYGQPLPAPNMQAHFENQHHAQFEPEQPHQQHYPQSSGRLNHVQTTPKPIITTDLPAEYRVLLLSLSEQYISEARRMAPSLVMSNTTAGYEKYHKLIASGLRCMEAVLRKQDRRTLPRSSATVQLYYALLLYEETENIDEAENVLSKGISFCEQNRLLDIKYSMQHLLARIMSMTNRRASLKFLDHAIQEATSLNHVVWIYSLRFLRVQLCLQIATAQEMHTALQSLSIICDMSRQQGDAAISIFANIQVAMVHLRLRANDSIGEAQRAIASANSQRSANLGQQCPQLDTLVDILDLTCSLDPYDYNTALRKLSIMQKAFDAHLETDSWSHDGVFNVPIERSQSGNLTQETSGIFTKLVDGRDCLSFQWLGKVDSYACGFILSAIATRQKNASSGHKMERFLKEGLKMTDETTQTPAPSTSQPLQVALAQRQWRRKLRAHLLLELTLAYADRSEWPRAHDIFVKFDQFLKTLDMSESEPLQVFSAYLSGVISHGLGDLTTALQKYQSSQLKLLDPPANKRITSLSLREELSILATFNILLIIRRASHPSHHLAEPLMETLTHYFPRPSHSGGQPQRPSATNPHLLSAHEFLLASLNSTTTPHTSPNRPPTAQSQSSTRILYTKEHLQRSLSLAKSASNVQIITFALSYLNSAFFIGAVGEQAVNSARAVHLQAGSRHDRLWMAVGCGMLGDVLGRVGRAEEAESALADGAKLCEELPAGVREALNV